MKSPDSVKFGDYTRSFQLPNTWAESYARTVSVDISGLFKHPLRAVPGERKSQLERLRTGPTRRSAPELVRALGRVDEIRSLAIDVSVSARLPRSRVLELARFAATAKVTAIERMGKERRAATLVALVSTLEATAQDDALDVLDIVLTDIFSEASKAGIKARLRTLKDLDAAAVQAGNVSKVVLDPNVADIEIRQTVFTRTRT